jgi:opacity protein-like surface antigen
MKKLVMLLCGSSLVVASAVQADWEENLLVGVMGGGAAQDGYFELNLALPTPAVRTATNNTGASEFIWGLFAGYQVLCNCWLFGAEVNVDWRNYNDSFSFAFTDFSNIGWNGTGVYRQDAVVGLTARIGYEFSPLFLPYIRLGAETSRDHLKVTLLNNAATASGIADNRQRQYRFVGGVGAETITPICGLTFRLEYNYSSEGGGVEVTDLASNGTSYLDSDIKVRTSAGKASLVYNF